MRAVPVPACMLQARCAATRGHPALRTTIGVRHLVSLRQAIQSHLATLGGCFGQLSVLSRCAVNAAHHWRHASFAPARAVSSGAPCAPRAVLGGAPFAPGVVCATRRVRRAASATARRCAARRLRRARFALPSARAREPPAAWGHMHHYGKAKRCRCLKPLSLPPLFTRTARPPPSARGACALDAVRARVGERATGRHFTPMFTPQIWLETLEVIVREAKAADSSSHTHPPRGRTPTVPGPPRDPPAGGPGGGGWSRPAAPALASVQPPGAIVPGAGPRGPPGGSR